MNTIYYSCAEGENLQEVFPFEGNYFEDEHIVIDVVGKVNKNEPLPLEFNENGETVEVEDTREPVWTNFLFNVIFKDEQYKDIFSVFESKEPVTPYRTFL